MTLFAKRWKLAEPVISDFKLILFMIALMWILELLNIAYDHQLNRLAIVPRQVDHLWGIIGMHFLHWSIPHLVANTLPLLVLGLLICIDGKGKQITLSIMLLTGLFVWFFARPGLHAGASGLVLGYWGYLLSNAFFERSIKNIILAIFTILIYGGIVFSLVNFRDGISFEGHIFGFVAGIISAWYFREQTTITVRS